MGGEMWSGGNNRDLSRGVDDSNNSSDLSLEIAALSDLVQPQQYGISSTQQPRQPLPYVTPQTQQTLTMAAGTAVYQPPLSSGGSLPYHGLLQHRAAPDFNVLGTTQSLSGSSQDDTASVESLLDIYQDTYQSTAGGSTVNLSALGQFHLPVVTGSSSFSGTSYSVRSSSAHVSTSDYPQQQIDEGRENRPFTPTNYQTLQQKELESFSQLLGQYEPVSTQGSERDTSEALMQVEQCLGTGSILVGGETMAAKYTEGRSVNRSNLSGSSLHGVGVVSKDTAVTNISGMCESYPETSGSSSLTTSFTPPPLPTTTCSISNATWNTRQSASFGDSFSRVTAARKRRLSGGSSQQQPSQLTGQSRRGGRTRIRSVSCGSAGAGIRDGEEGISDGQSFSPASEILLYPMGDNQDDDDRTLRRRERNRLAAQKCRQKKRDAAQGLFKQYQDLESSNTSLKYDIRVYRKQKEELEQMLAEHLKQCSNSVLRQRDSVTPHHTPASTSNSQRVRHQPARTHTLTSGGAVSISNAETSKARGPLVIATCTCQTATTSPARNITQQRPMNYSMPATRVAGPSNPANTGAGGDLSGSGSSSIPSAITAMPVRDPEEIRTINQLISQSQHKPTAIRSDPGGTFQKHWSQDATPPTPNTASLSQNSSQFNLAVSSRGVDSSIRVNLQRRASQTYPQGNSNAPLVIPPPSLPITSSPAYSQNIPPAVSETATAVVTTAAGDSNQQSAGQYDSLLQQIRQLQQGGNQAGQYDPT